MWRDEVGMMEMLLSYISEFNQFESWSSWRPILIDILSSHEDVRRERFEMMMQPVKDESLTYTKEIECSRAANLEVEDVRTGTFEVSRLSGVSDRGRLVHSRFDVETSKIEMPDENESSGEDKEFVMDPSKVQQSYFTSFEMSAPMLPSNVGDSVTASDALQLYSAPVDEDSLMGSAKGEWIEDELISYSKSDSFRNKSETSNGCEFVGVKDQIDTVIDLTECGYSRNSDLSRSRQDEIECCVCGKTFKRKNDLVKHERVHTGERPYRCDVCGKTFTMKGSLGLHKQKHTGVRPFSCEICGKTFGRKYCYETHTRTHTGERPYACTICGKSFTQSGVLYIHMRKHRGSAAALGSESGEPSSSS